jgi:ribulose-5-phosphate 4-epimerase/fuculose-1-phosphate aldolase
MTAVTDADALRADIITACRVLSHFRIVEGFGHVSARLPGSDHVLITPRRALGLVTSAAELVELDPDGQQVGGQGRPPLEAVMHLAVYRRRPDVGALCRGHPRHVAAFASAAEPIQVAHGFGANLGHLVPVHSHPFLVTSWEAANSLADVLGTGEGIVLQANGMLVTGQTVADACVKGIFLEEMAQVQLLARAAGLQPRAYSPETAARRNGDDKVHEPIRAWEYYVAVAQETGAWP